MTTTPTIPSDPADRPGGHSSGAGPDSFSEPGSEEGIVSASGSGREPTIAEIEAHPLREMLVIAAPTVVTMTSYTVMQFIDALMVKSIGPDPVYVSAQGNGGMVAWLLMSLVIGLTTVVNTYVSQNLGAGRPREGAAYAWNALWISVLMWASILVPVAIAAPFLFSLAGHTENLLRLETTYAQIMLMGGLFVVTSRGIGHYFFGMHKPAVVMVSALTANVVNIGANYALIFGHLGLPAMGVAGAALGSVLGAFVEFCIPLAVFLSPAWAAKFGTRAAWKPDLRKIKDIARIGWPGSLMFFNEMACWTYLMAILVPRAGAAAGENPVLHNTAGWIALRYMHLSFMPAVGISIAITAIVGKCMGQGRPDLAASRTWLALKLGLVYMGTCAVAFLIFREPLVGLFVEPSTPEAERIRLVEIGAAIMIAAAVFQLFDAAAIVMSGALRGAGDTVWPGIATIVLSWTCIVGVGHLMIWLAPGLGSLGPWIGAAAFIIFLGTALLWRFLGGKWRSIKLVGGEGSTPAA